MNYGTLTGFRERVLSLAFALGLLTVMLVATTTPANAQGGGGQPDPFTCYGVGDEFLADANGDLDPNGTASDFDYLAVVDRVTGNATPIGPTDTRGIEAISFVTNPAGPIYNVLYAVANDVNDNGGTADTLGTIDLTTGLWSPIGGAIGSGTGPDGTEHLFRDIDGLTFDVQNNVMWATERNTGGGEPDLLLQIDLATGQLVADAFGAGIDWVPVPVATEPGWVNADGDPYDDIDDIAVDPVTGQMIAIMNKGGAGGGLVTLNPADGTVITYVGLFAGNSPDGIIDDMEGLAFFNDGQVYGSTGANGPDNGDKNKLFVIDVATGVTTEIGSFPAGVQDIEALGCLTAPGFIDLEKATNGEDADEPTGPEVDYNSTVTWTYVIRNTGAILMTDIVLVDDVLGQINPAGVGCLEGPIPDLWPVADPQGPTTFTCSVEGPADTLGQYQNNATVEGTYTTPAGAFVVGDEDPSHYFSVATPAIDIEKATNGEDADAAPGPVVGVGSTVTWTYVVTNTGNINLANVAVTDDQLDDGDIVCDPFLADAGGDNVIDLLPVGESVTCTATGTAVLGQYENNANAIGDPVDNDGDPVDGGPVEDDDPSHYIGDETPVPGIALSKTVLAGHGVDCTTAVEGTDELVEGATGDPITYCFVVTNTGNTHLNDIVVDDPDIGITRADMTLISGVEPLAPGATLVFAYETELVEDLVNTASTSGNPTDEDGNDLPDLDDPEDDNDAEVDLPDDALVPGIELSKTVLEGADADCTTAVEGDDEMVEGEIGDAVTWCFVVTNTGNTYLDDVAVGDATLGITRADMTLVSGAEPLAPGEQLVFSYSGVIETEMVNIATTTGNPTDEDGNDLPDLDDPEDEDDAEVAPPPMPAIELSKTVLAGHGVDCTTAVEGVDELVSGVAGDLVTYCFIVTNTGNTYLNNIVVDDPDIGITRADMTLVAGVEPLAPGDSLVFAYETTLVADLVNTASTSGDPSDENGNDLPGVDDPTDSDDAEVETTDVEVLPLTGSNSDSFAMIALMAMLTGIAALYIVRVLGTPSRREI